MWQQQKPQQSREEEEEQKVHWSVYCLRKQSITGTADFDNYIQEKFDRSATLLSLCWPTYRKCEQVLRNKEQGLLGRALIRTTIVMFLMWPY